MRTSSPSIWLSLFLHFGGATRAPKPSKLGFPTAYGLCPFFQNQASELCKVGGVWMGPSSRMFFRAAMSPLAVGLDAPSFEPLEPRLDGLEGRPLTAAIGAALFAGVGPAVGGHPRHSGRTAVLDLRLFDAPTEAIDELVRVIAEEVGRGG